MKSNVVASDAPSDRKVGQRQEVCRSGVKNSALATLDESSANRKQRLKTCHAVDERTTTERTSTECRVADDDEPLLSVNSRAPAGTRCSWPTIAKHTECDLAMKPAPAASWPPIISLPECDTNYALVPSQLKFCRLCMLGDQN